jgi:hypothetical protein
MGRGDFEITIIYALKLEADAVEALFDKFWGDGKGTEKRREIQKHDNGCISQETREEMRLRRAMQKGSRQHGEGEFGEVRTK